MQRLGRRRWFEGDCDFCALDVEKAYADTEFVLECALSTLNSCVRMRLLNTELC